MVRSAFRLQFWTFYWRLERERMHLARTLPADLTAPGQPVPSSAKIVPVLTRTVNLLDDRGEKSIEEIPLRSLLKAGRHLVLNFGSCT